MPQLNAQASIVEQDVQFEIVEQAAKEGRQTLTNLAFSPLPLVDMNKLVEAYFAPLREMQETMGKMFATSVSTIFAEALSESVKSQNRALSVIISSSFADIAKAASIGMFPASIIDAEIIDKPKDIRKPELANAVIPYQPSTSALTIVEPFSWKRGKMGLKKISGGNFSYKRKILVGLSINNREGQLIGLMLENPDLFISDEIIDKNFHTCDTLGRSDLAKLLKNKFKLNKLTAVIKRQGKGYILINITPLYIN